ncbi:unnamed protein product [Withania somnifera]
MYMHAFKLKGLIFPVWNFFAELPKYLFKGELCRDGGIIEITQPRRVAAITVAKRVAEDCGVPLGQMVGYAIRFKDVTSGQTKIKYMTGGLLPLLDPYLSKYSIIIVDEAHERTIHTDLLLGLLKNLQKARSKSINGAVNTDHNNSNNGHTLEERIDNKNNGILKPCQAKKYNPLKLIIMSASLDARVFSEYFGGARAVHVQGRQFPVDIFYTHKPETDCIYAALITIFQFFTLILLLCELEFELIDSVIKFSQRHSGFVPLLLLFTIFCQIHLEEGSGDVLVFLTGQEEIESVERLIHERLRQLPECSRKLLTFPIFSSLPSEKQFRWMYLLFCLYLGSLGLCVILATNIAETSVTIPGIRYVIDPGLVKARTCDPKMGVDSLIIVTTSKAQALQRRCDLSNVVLQLKALGIDDIINFDFIEKPDRTAIINSLWSLYLLGAVTEDNKLSDVGHQMSRLPLDPVYSKALIVASQFGCLKEMLICVAMLSVESVFYAPREKLEESRNALKSFANPEGDHLTLLNVYRAADEFFQKNKMVNSGEKAEKILRKWCKDDYIKSRSLKHARDIHRVTLSGLIVQIHPSSVLFRAKPECIVFNELVHTNHTYVRNVSRIDYLWLIELAPNLYAVQD